jgi:FlgD Ig-like domain
MRVQRTILRGLLLAVLAFVFAAPARAASTIGLYTDENASSCSFSGNQSGLVNVYVIVKPDNLGISGVRFSAPVPACFGGTWVGDITPSGVNSIGDSPTDISLAFRGPCAIEPTYMLQIQYMRTSTTPCCAYTIQPAGGWSYVEGTTCTFNDVSVTPIISHFNAGPTCPCSDPKSPHPPQDPVPANGATLVSWTPSLSWSSPLDGDIVSYDVYLGTSAQPPLVGTVTAPPYQPPQPLQEGTQYWWRVVAHDADGLQETSPTWSFTTRLTNNAPFTPVPSYPSNYAYNIPVGATLIWTGSDPDGDALKYDVYLGTVQAPPLVASNITTNTYKPASNLPQGAQLYWKIVARDPAGLTATSGLFQFTTAANQAPSVPSSPSPGNGASSVALNPMLIWVSTDDAPGLVFDVYFGPSTSTPPLVATVSTNQYQPGTLQLTTTYRWKIVARDADGVTSTGPLWTFYTASPPQAVNPIPANGGVGASPLTLTWTASAINSVPVYCDVYFGTTNPPPLATTGLSSSGFNGAFAYDPGNLVVGATYYWRVHAYDSFGGTPGTVWSFTGAMKGDVNRDGLITADDAACAFKMALANYSCAAVGLSSLADVNCSTGVTPRDALCIHRRAIGQVCPFCGEAQTIGPVLSPAVTITAYWQSGNVTYVRLGLLGVNPFEAFAFDLRTPTNVQTSIVPIGLTTAFTAMDMNTVGTITHVGGYSLNSVDASSTNDFIELRFTVSGTLVGFISAENFRDDLYGQGSMTIISGSGKGGGGGTPVKFARFDAKPEENAVRVTWLMHFVDAAESYTLYRHETGRSPLTIASGPATEANGSYLDGTVEPGHTYRYEMLVRTADGDDVRSPLVSVTVPALGLALGPNHPNPFNPQTTIPYYVPAGEAPVRVRLIIYDTSGRSVRVLVNENQAGGPREVVWHGDDEAGKAVSSGIYFCVLQVGNERRTQKLVLLK